MSHCAAGKSAGARVDHAATGAPRWSEEALIAKAIATNPPQQWAFSELWRRHDVYVRAFCARRLSGIAEAEDVSQNVALKAFNALNRFEGRSCFRTWLTAIAITQCADHQRREARQKNIAQRLFALHCGLHADNDTGDRVDHLAMARSACALRNLPPRARDVIIMRFYRDLSLDDISNELNLGLSGAKMRLYRSIERLRTTYFQLETADSQM